MQLKILSKRTLLVVVLMMYGLSLALIFYFIPKNSAQRSLSLIENTITLPNQEQLGPGLPIRLKIPKISVNSYAEYVGLTSNGAMDVPKERFNVAWFELGQRPGEVGSAVIAGHYGRKDGKASAFDNLHKLRKGDKLYVEDEWGIIIPFVVREIRRYDPNADASSVFVSNDGKSHLNLITCEGGWNKITESYSERLVIFADKE